MMTLSLHYFKMTITFL